MEVAPREKSVIIAMKGHTCTGKTTMAQILAKNLKCVLIEQDEIYDRFSDLISDTDAEHRSFEAICRIAAKQLQLGIFAKIVVDSPLLHQSHMDRLLQMSKSMGVRLVIIECKPGDKYEWERRFMARHEIGTSSSGYSYKPSTWEDVETLLENSWGEYEYDRSGDVSELVVDTTKFFKDHLISMAVYDLCNYKRNHSVDFYKWAGGSYTSLEPENEKWMDTQEESIEDELISDIHLFVLFNEEDGNDDTSRGRACRGCLKPISGPFYNCSNCNLSLHKLCAELPDKKQLLPHQNPPFVNPNSHEFFFPETHECKFHPQGFDPNCRDCAFETNLRCGLVPPIVYLNCHQHLLFFMMTSTSNFGHNQHFQCHACGGLGGEAFYTCGQCSLVLHINCALLPPTRKDIHHRHHLTLATPHDFSDEVYCDSCENRRNPRNWIYYCEECDFTSHLYCDNFSPI